MPGKLIVLEGIDGAGTETQSKLLVNYLNDNGIPAVRLSYPDYEHPIGKLIDAFLYKKFDLTVKTQVLIHLADRVKDAEKIRQLLDEGKVVISDRYATTTMGYQGAMGFSVEKIIQIAEMFDLPKPDIVIYLKISANTSIERKLGEKDNLDRNESKHEFLHKVGEFYINLAEKNTFGKWVVIDGEKPKEDVFKEIKVALEL